MAGLKKMRLAAGIVALCVAGAAGGQVQAPTTIPGLENYSLPGESPAPTPVATPTPVAPIRPPRSVTPRPEPTPTPTPTATSGGATRTPVPRPTPTPTPTPVVAATPAARSTAAPETVPAASPSAAPTDAPDQGDPGTTAQEAAVPPASTVPETAPATGADAREPSGIGSWLWPVLVGLIVLAGAGWFLRRRRSEKVPALPAPVEEVRRAPDREASPTAAATVMTPGAATLAEDTQPAAPPPVQPSVRPSAGAPAPQFLDRSEHVPPASIALEDPVVSRAGLNMVTATADVTVVLRNTSDVIARNVVLDVRLTSAQSDQDAAIAALFAVPGRPATPPFDLAPGETKRVRALATMPRDAITVLQAGGRPMFVPVVAIRAVHAGGQTTSVHALGIERPGQAKLGPIWLDQPSRMFDTVGVRPHNGQW